MWIDLLGWVAGPVLALLAGVVGLSAVQAHFALETKPIWDVGVLRYGYKNPGINQVLQTPFRARPLACMSSCMLLLWLHKQTQEGLAITIFGSDHSMHS